nr:hypothetical protein [Cressdnaviricota sp.]
MHGSVICAKLRVRIVVQYLSTICFSSEASNFFFFFYFFIFLLDYTTCLPCRITYLRE